MRIVHSWVFYLLAHFIELCLQSKRTSDIDWPPTPRPRHHQPPPSLLGRPESAAEFQLLMPDRFMCSLHTSPPVNIPPVSTPPASIPPASAHPCEVLGYGLGQLGLIRLLPLSNQNRRFEFRRYTFHIDLPLLKLVKKDVYESLPSTEQIVFTTSNGDIFAILETSGVLSGLYSKRKSRPRVKISITHGMITPMNSDDVRECPVGKRRSLYLNFTVVVAKEDSLRLGE